jgi:ribosomal protein L3 glutamine methyltransferase
MSNIIIEELDTLIDFVRWATTQFNQAKLYFGHGTDNALDEALALVTQTLHLPRYLPDSLLQAKLTCLERRLLLERIQKRIQQRIPLPYLTEKAWFAELEFYVDNRVLIPRSPIAELIANDFVPWLDMNSVNRVLDIGTGSGCIAIAIAHYFRVEVDAVDISNDALTVAKKNIAQHQLEHWVHAVNSDLFANLSGLHYDLIVTNPPYVDAQEIKMMPPEYHHEPLSALEAGKDGLLFVKQILRDAVKHLTEDGILIVEVGASAPAVIEQYPDVPFTWLEFENGGDGVFLLSAEQMQQYQATFEQVASHQLGSL